MRTTKTDAMEDIERAIAQHMGVSQKELCGQSREVEYVQARHATWYAIHTLLNCPYAYIARVYHRDHTTVLYAVRKIKNNKEKSRAICKLFLK